MAYCTNCGAELEDGARFCTNCGALADGSDQVADASAWDGSGASGARGTASDVDATTLRSAPVPSSAYVNMPPQYPESTGAQSPQRRRGAGAAVAVTLGIVCAVLIAAFGIFYFTNPLGLTEGIFANSAAAQEAAAAQAQAESEAQAEADEAQQQLEEAQQRADDLQRQLDESEAQNSNKTSAVPDNSQDSDNSTSSTGRTVTAPAGYPAVRITSSGEVLPGSDSRTITRSDVNGMNDWELCVARNEVIARHGYSFKRDDLREFFSNLSWYTPDPSYSDSEVSKLEWDNMNTILDLENERGSQYVQ